MHRYLLCSDSGRILILLAYCFKHSREICGCNSGSRLSLICIYDVNMLMVMAVAIPSAATYVSNPVCSRCQIRYENRDVLFVILITVLAFTFSSFKLCWHVAKLSSSIWIPLVTTSWCSLFIQRIWCARKHVDGIVRSYVFMALTDQYVKQL